MANRPKYSAMSLTALREYARTDLGLSGLSKAPRERVMTAIRQATQPKPMDNFTRGSNYAQQRGLGFERALAGDYTPRQRRRIRKHFRKYGS